MVENEIKELKVCYQTSHSFCVQIISGCGCTGGAVGVTITPQARSARPHQRAVDEISATDQHWTAVVTATERHQWSKIFVYYRVVM